MSADGPQSDDEFVRTHERYVRGIVKQACAQLGLECDPEDLVSFGFAGLLEARARYDATKGVPFKAFAHYRVRGAVIDGVRKMAYLPRRAYARLRAAEALDRGAETLGERRAAEAQRGEREPDTAAGVRALDAVLGAAAAAFAASSASEEPVDTSVSPERAALNKERRALVLRALAELPDRERALVRGHDLEGRRLDELAQEAGLSKSWASRLHAKGLDRLRQRLRDA